MSAFPLPPPPPHPAGRKTQCATYQLTPIPPSPPPEKQIQATYELLRTRFGARPCGVRTIKGKGEMRTYFLDNGPPTPDAPDTPPPLSKFSPSAVAGCAGDGGGGGGSGGGQPSSCVARSTTPATTALWLQRATAIVSPKPHRAPPLLMPPSVVAIGSSPPPVGPHPAGRAPGPRCTWMGGGGGATSRAVAVAAGETSDIVQPEGGTAALAGIGWAAAVEQRL